MRKKTKIISSTPDSKRGFAVFDARKSALSPLKHSPVGQILYLQQTIGNQAVQRLFRSGALQPKIKIGQPNDKYEQEADRIADQVTCAPQKVPVEYMHEPLKEKEEFFQKKQAGDRTSRGDSSLEAQIHSLTGGGQPLPESARSYFESLFDHDFSQVRVHTDPKAAETAKSVNAKAFTVGREVVFDVDQYAPHSTIGRSLLAHELTHVVQQTDQVQSGQCKSTIPSKNQNEPLAGIAIRQVGTSGQDLVSHSASSNILLQRKPKKETADLRKRRLKALSKIHVAIRRIQKALSEGLRWGYETITKKGAEFTIEGNRVAESMAKRQKRLKQLLMDLIQFTMVLESKPVPASWLSPQFKMPAGSFEGASMGGGTIVNFGWGPSWEDPLRYFVNWQLKRKRDAGILQVNFLYIADAPEATRAKGVPRIPLSKGVPAGIWIFVPDPDNRPLDYQRYWWYQDMTVLDRVFEVWMDDLGFFYYIHKNKKHYLPEEP